MRLRALLSALSLSLACCHEPFRGFCGAPPSIAVMVVVNDSVTGVSLADSTHGIAQAGTYIDSLRLINPPLDPPPRLEGGSRTGTYQVVLDRVGYREWTRNGIVVSQQGPCGNVIPVHLVALLQRAP